MANILYKYLHTLQHPTSGLLESFPGSADPALHGVGFTYDLALASLVFSHHRALEEAGQIMEFFRSMPLPSVTNQDYNTAYQVDRRLATLEDAFQVGPMAWVAIALVRYAQASGQLLYYVQKAVADLDWVRRHLEHFHGGVVMGLREPWRSRMSVENNWAYYTALRVAGSMVPDGPMREMLTAERRGVRQWLTRNEGRRGEEDNVRALDVHTNALLVGPAAHLEDGPMGSDRAALAAWAEEQIEQIEAYFKVPGGCGYDFTDAAEARRADRPRASWLEGTEQVVLAYQTWAPFFEAVDDPAYARTLLRRAGLAHAAVMRCSLLVGNGVAIPNTDSPEPFKTFADGWIARPWTEPALNGTTWTYFVETGFNPFTTNLPVRP